MSLTKFKLPGVTTRLVKHGDRVFKFKIHYRNEYSRLPSSDETVRKEIEQIMRVIFNNPGHQYFQPMKTDHFVAFPYKERWTKARKLEFLEKGKKLRISQNVFNIYLIDNDMPLPEGRSENETNQGSLVSVPSVNDVAAETSTTNEVSAENNENRSEPKGKRTHVQTKQHALRKKTRSNEDSGAAESVKRPSRRSLRSNARTEEKEAKQADRSPVVGTEAEGSMPAEPEGGIVLAGRRQPDRDTIQQNQLQELMRLQQLARPSGQNSSVTEQQPTVQEQPGLLRSVWNAVMTPAKKLIRGRESNAVQSADN